MNSYARLAHDYTLEYRPEAYAALADPEEFFTSIGAEMADRVPGLRDALLGAQREGENIYEFHVRGLQAYRTAEELAVHDHWIMLAPPEHDDQNDDEDDEDLEGGGWDDDCDEDKGEDALTLVPDAQLALFIATDRSGAAW